MDPERDSVPLASVTKIFTALAILQLVEDGRIALDAPIHQYMPGLRLHQRFGDISVAHLLGHSAGLEERHAGYFRPLPALPKIAQLSAILPRQIRPPQEVIAYSNASYVLLGQIVAQVTGRPFAAHLTEAILAPLGVDDPRFMHAPPEHRGTSPFHVWQAGRYMAIDPAPTPEVHTASGGLALTARDVGHVMQALLRQKTAGRSEGLSASAIAAMREPAVPERAEFAARTLGYWTDTWAGHTVFHHGGTHFGFHTNMVLVPSLDLGFFVVANGPSGAALMGLPRRALREIIAPDNIQRRPRAACDATCQEAYAGHFIATRRNDTGLDRLRVSATPIVRVHPSGDEGLLVDRLGYSRLFAATGEDQFETPEGDMRLGFRRNAKGAVVGGDLGDGFHSFDRLTFWRSEHSLHTGLVAVLFGVLVSAGAAGVAWRRSGRPISVPLVLSLGWMSLAAGSVVLIQRALDSRDVSSWAGANAGLWTVTAFYAGACALLVWAVVWLVRQSRAAKTRRGERVLVWAAVPCIAWALLTAWVWNVPTAALTW